MRNIIRLQYLAEATGLVDNIFEKYFCLGVAADGNIYLVYVAAGRPLIAYDHNNPLNIVGYTVKWVS